ncbi:hypothetical protein [Pseudomonas sp. 24 E 13]|nr:hypothetical protein [Pseudomonas sp. 24 E 13]
MLLARVVSVLLVRVFLLLLEPNVTPMPPLLIKPDFLVEDEWLCSKVSVAPSITTLRPAIRLVAFVDTTSLALVPMSRPARTTTVSALMEEPRWVIWLLLSMRVFWLLESKPLLVLVLR